MFHERSGIHLFTVRDVDVHVSIWYLLLMAFILFSPAMSGGPAATGGLAVGFASAIAVTMALLVHEFGHAVVSKYYDLGASVLLHGFGGLCMHRPAETDGDDARILLAGPGAGLLFGAVSFAGLVLLAPLVGSQLVGTFFYVLTWVNVVWNLANLLLPIWPLDGGKLFHLLLRRFTSGTRARQLALQTSIVTTIVAGVGALAYLGFSFYIALLGFFILMGNVQMLRQGAPLVDRAADQGEPIEFHVELLEEAREAMESENWRETYRICHQLRSTGGNLAPDVLEQVWELLSVSATRLGKYDEAESYFERAPETAEVREARREWETARGDEG